MSTKFNKPVRVAPHVTDPTMRSSKGTAEALLSDELGEPQPDENHQSIFGSPAKTKEEQEAEKGKADNSQTGTILVIVFALIVIALVALIVWMLMKQNNDQKDEEFKRMMHMGTHKNNMPHKGDPSYDAHQRNMAVIHNQQAAMQQQMQQLNSNLNTNEKTFAEAMADKHKPAAGPVLESIPEKPAKKYSKNAPASNNSLHTNDVDDVLAKTQELLNKKAAKKDTDDEKQELTDLDKALLDKVHSNNETADEDEDDEEE